MGPGVLARVVQGWTRTSPPPPSQRDGSRGLSFPARRGGAPYLLPFPSVLGSQSGAPGPAAAAACPGSSLHLHTPKSLPGRCVGASGVCFNSWVCFLSLLE